MQTAEVVAAIAVAWPVVTGILNAALSMKSDEEWIAMAERSPRFVAFKHLLEAIGLDPLWALDAIRRIAAPKKQPRTPTILPPLAVLAVAVAIVVGSAGLAACTRQQSVIALDLAAKVACVVERSITTPDLAKALCGVEQEAVDIVLQLASAQRTAAAKAFAKGRETGMTEARMGASRNLDGGVDASGEGGAK